MTRSMMRGAAVFAASTAMAAGLLLSGCSAGQVTQTENQQPPVSGVNIDSEDGTVQLRNVEFQYSGTAGYKSGQAAPLRVRIFNQNLTPVRLVGVASDAGAVVLAGRGVTAPAPPPTSAPPAASGSASGAPSASGSASGSASASASASASPSASATPSGPPTNPTIDVEVPVRGYAVLDPSLERYLQITGLREELKPGSSVEVTFRFRTGDGKEIVISTPVPVGIPLSPPPRSPLHFEEGQGH